MAKYTKEELNSCSKEMLITFLLSMQFCQNCHTLYKYTGMGLWHRKRQILRLEI